MPHARSTAVAPRESPAGRGRATTGGLVTWLAAVAAALGIWGLAPFAPGDPLREPLALLPLVLAAFAAAGRRLGGRASSRQPGLDVGAVALLTTAALARARLGLAAPEAWVEGGLMAALALVLGWRVAALLPALLKALGRQPGRSPGVVFFLLPWLVYLALMPWLNSQRPPNGDEPYYLLTTHSLAYDLDRDLTNNYAAGDSLHFLDHRIEPQIYDPTGPRGELYSRHSAILPAMLAPAYRVAGIRGVLATMAALAAALAWLTLRLALGYYPRARREALLVWALTAFTAPLLLYSYQVWVEVPAALLVALALDRVRALESRPGDRRGWIALAAGLGVLALLKLRFVLLSAALAALAWWRTGRRRKALLVVGGLALAGGLGLAAYNMAVFGNPLHMHRWDEVTTLPQRPPTDYLRGLMGLWLDGAFGLAGSAPLWLLLGPAALLQLRRRDRAARDLVLILLPYAVVLTPRLEWYGGWAPPFRYGMAALPLLALLLVPLLAGRRRPGARLVLAALGAATLALTLLWVAQPNWTFNFAEGRSHLLDAVSGRLSADVARFFPSYVRARAASWLWPAAGLVLVPLLWWLPWRLPRRLSGTGLAAAGVAALLGGAAVLAHATVARPTTTVEAEDPWVAKEGGALDPERWTPSRVRFSGGWRLGPGDRLRVPVVPGGDSFRLTVEAEWEFPDDALTLEARAGETPLGAWRITRRPPRRRELTSETALWPPGAELLLSLDGTPGAGAVVVDRLRFEWEPAAAAPPGG